MSTSVERLSQEAQVILKKAEAAALQRHSLYIDVEHLLLALLEDANPSEPLKSLWQGIDRPKLAMQLSGELGMVREDAPWKQAEGLTQALKTLLEYASRQTRLVHSAHLLLAMFDSPSELVQQLLKETGLDPAQLRNQLSQMTPSTEKPQRPPEPVIILQEPRRAAPPRPTSGFPPIDTIWYYILAGVLGVFVYLSLFNPPALISFGLVFVGWVFSVTLHEFAHAIVAYWGGDYTVRDKGYLTFNPLRYGNPFLSIFLPVLFLILGGIGLPGGAVYIRTDLLGLGRPNPWLAKNFPLWRETRVRNRVWRTMVALAGPASNALCLPVLALPFVLGIFDFTLEFEGTTGRIQSAFAFLILLEITAVFFNLLPLPPLDGFNAIAPYLPDEIVQTAYSFGLLSIFFVFYLMRLDSVSVPFFDAVYSVMDFLQVPYYLASFGYQLFKFWS